MQPWCGSIWTLRVWLWFWTAETWTSSQTTDKIVYISLAAAVDSRFGWEKIGKGALEQPTAISMDKESSREKQLCSVFDNACTYFEAKHEYCEALCSNQIWVRLDSPSRWVWPSTREYLQASNTFLWYIANGFVCWLSWEFLFMNLFKNITFARDCCWYMLLAAPSS